MSVSARTVEPPECAASTIVVGLEVHKESVTLAVLLSDAPAPVRVDILPYDLKCLRRHLEKLGPADRCEHATRRRVPATSISASWPPGHCVHGDPAVAHSDEA